MESNHFLQIYHNVRSHGCASVDFASHANGGDALEPFAALGCEIIHLDRYHHPRIVLNMSSLQKTAAWLCDLVS